MDEIVEKTVERAMDKDAAQFRITFRCPRCKDTYTVTFVIASLQFLRLHRYELEKIVALETENAGLAGAKLHAEEACPYPPEQ